MLPVAVLFSLVIAYVTITRFPRKDRQFFAAAYGLHVVATGAVVWMNMTLGGDMEGYDLHGQTLVNLLHLDFGRWFPEVARLVAHQAPSMPVPQYYDEMPATTRAMDGLTAIVYVLIGGPSLAGACLIVASLSFAGKALMFRAVRDSLAEADQRYAAWGLMMVPSAVFWTCGLVKEAFAITGMGFCVYGLQRVFVRRAYLGALAAAFGVALIVTVKPYILFPITLAFAAWFFAARAKGRLSPRWLLVGAAIAFVGVLIMGKLFPEFALDHVGESIANQRMSSGLATGGSYVGNVSPEDAYGEVDTSLGGQLRFLPLAIVNALFRPFFFEVRTVPQLAAAIENTVLLVVLVTVIVRFRVRAIVRTTLGSPFLAAALVFTIVFGASVGLANQNLGTLSRYRAPMMPAYVTSMLLLRRRLRGVPDRRAERAAAPVRAPGQAALAQALARRRNRTTSSQPTS